MRIGLISDTEGNIAALEAAVTAMKAHAPDVRVFAGDVLECPFSPDPPAETIALLRAEHFRTVPGNHDRYLMDWGTPRWSHTLWMRLRRSDPAGPWLDEIAAGQAAGCPGRSTNQGTRGLRDADRRGWQLGRDLAPR